MRRIRAIGEAEYLTLHTDFDLFCVCVIYSPPRRPSTQHTPDPGEGLYLRDVGGEWEGVGADRGPQSVSLSNCRRLGTAGRGSDTKRGYL